MKNRKPIRSLLTPKSREEALAAVRKTPQFEKDSALVYEAVVAGDADAVEILLAGGANVFGTYGANTLIQRARDKGFDDVVEVIQRHMRNTGLTEARSVRSFLKPKTDAEALKKLETATQEQKDEALVDAAENGDAKAVQLLLDAGADVRADKGAPLRWAASSGRTEVVKLLLAAGADVHAKEEAALRWAADDCHIAVVKILLDAGADIESGIHYAKSWGMKVATQFLENIPTNESQSVRSFLKPKTAEEVRRAIQNSSPAQRKQAIQQSVMNNDVKTLEMLKAAGFELNHDLIESLVWRPARDGHFEMIKYLYEEGVNLNTIEDAVFRWAARRGHLKIVRFMVEEVGVDLNARENWALENSIQYRRFDVARYLIDAGADNVIWLPMLEGAFIQELADIHQNQKKIKSRGIELSLWFAPNTPRMGVESYLELNNVPGGIEIRVLGRRSK